MTAFIGRRDFITLLGGAAAAWPGAAWPQERVRRVGVLSDPGADDAEMQFRTAAFVQGLRELGWTVGGTCRSNTVGATVMPNVDAPTRQN